MFRKVRRWSVKLYRRFVAVRHNATGPIVVYQMGKVGSSSIEASLRSLYLDQPVYHCHVLVNLEALEGALRRVLPNPHEEPGGSIQELRRARAIRDRFLAEAHEGRWSFISMVRDPVARNLSAFFQSVTERIPDFYQRLSEGRIDTPFIAEHFLKDEVTHNAPIVWFDEQMRGLTGIDVFERPFPHETGYQTYENARARLLVMRLENFPGCVQPAMCQFLGIQRFGLIASNAAEDKDYADVYRRVKREIALPEAYLDRMYNSNYARHFYAQPEIARFRASWSRAGTS
jgi:hypothetical protein